MLDTNNQHHHPIHLDEHYVNGQRYVIAHCPRCELWDAVRVEAFSAAGLVYLGEFITEAAALEAITKDQIRN